MSKKKIYGLAEKIRKADIAIGNAAHPDIQPHLEPLGLTVEAIDIGAQKLKRTKFLIEEQKRKYSIQYCATADLHTKFDNAKKITNITYRLAKIYLKNDTARGKGLGLHEKRESTITGWIEQSNTLYTNMTDEFIGELSRFKYTADKFVEERELVREVEAALRKKIKETGEAQEATIKRDLAIEDLFNWTEDFYEVTKLALIDKPQAREKLGLLER